MEKRGQLNPEFSLWLMGYDVKRWLASSPGWSETEYVRAMVSDYFASLEPIEPES